MSLLVSKAFRTIFSLGVEGCGDGEPFVSVAVLFPFVGCVTFCPSSSSCLRASGRSSTCASSAAVFCCRMMLSSMSSVNGLSGDDVADIETDGVGESGGGVADRVGGVGSGVSDISCVGGSSEGGESSAFS